MTYDAVGHSHGRFAWSLQPCLLWPSLRECEEFVDRVLVWERCLGHWPGRFHWKKESKKLLQTQTEMPKPRSDPILIEIWFYCFLIPWPDGSSLQEFDAICPLANQLVVKLFNIYHQILGCGTWLGETISHPWLLKSSDLNVGSSAMRLNSSWPFSYQRVAMLPSG